MEKTFIVKGMSCGHCSSSVKGALEGIGGVSNATVDLDTGKVDVVYMEGETSIAEMVEAVEDQGYDVEA